MLDAAVDSSIKINLKFVTALFHIKRNNIAFQDLKKKQEASFQGSEIVHLISTTLVGLARLSKLKKTIFNCEFGRPPTKVQL